jgi:hypothetical protein
MAKDEEPRAIDLDFDDDEAEETVLAPDQAALVVDPNGEMWMILPDYPDDAEVPGGVLLLAAVLRKAKDPEWVDEMLAELDAAPTQ